MHPFPLGHAAGGLLTFGGRQAAETISIALTVVAVARGFGRPVYFLTPDDQEVIGVSTYIVFIVALWASCFARISVACLLLKFTQSRAWRVVLWAAIAFQVALLVGCDVIELLQCRPIRAIWAVVPDAQCMETEHVWAMAYVFIGKCQIASDSPLLR
jgi:hypothetical protein